MLGSMITISHLLHFITKFATSLIPFCLEKTDFTVIQVTIPLPLLVVSKKKKKN